MNVRLHFRERLEDGSYSALAQDDISLNKFIDQINGDSEIMLRLGGALLSKESRLTLIVAAPQQE